MPRQTFEIQKLGATASKMASKLKSHEKGLPETLEEFLNMTDSEDEQLDTTKDLGTSSSKTERPSKSTSESKESDVSLLNAASQALKEALEDTDDDDLTTSELIMQDKNGTRPSEFWWMDPNAQKSLDAENELVNGHQTPTQPASPVKDATSWLKQPETDMDATNEESYEKPMENHLVLPPSDFQGDISASLLESTEDNKKRFFKALEDAGIKPNFELDIHDEEEEDDDDEVLQSAESLLQQKDDSVVKSILEESGIESSMLMDMVKKTGYSSASFTSFTEQKSEVAAPNRTVAKEDAQQGFKDDATSLMESATEMSQQLHSTTQEETSNDVEKTSEMISDTKGLPEAAEEDESHLTEKLTTTLEAISRFSDEPTEQQNFTVNDTINSFDISSILRDVKKTAEEPPILDKEPSEASIAPIIDDIVSSAVSQAEITVQPKNELLNEKEEGELYTSITSEAEKSQGEAPHKSRRMDPLMTRDELLSVMEARGNPSSNQAHQQDDLKGGMGMSSKAIVIDESTQVPSGHEVDQKSQHQDELSKLSLTPRSTPKKRSIKPSPAPSVKSPSRQPSTKKIGSQASSPSKVFSKIGIDVQPLSDEFSADHQIQELEYELTSKTKEIETLKQDITLLETILEKEQETSRKLLAKAHLPDSQNPDVEKLKQDLEEQEMLIHGYQIENERLVEKNKEVTKALRESEKKELLQVEKLSQEIASLKSQLTQQKTLNTSRPIISAEVQIRIDSLRKENESLKRDAEDQEAALLAEIELLKAQNKDLQKKPTTVQSERPMELDLMERKNFEAYIVELETKLETLMDSQKQVERLQSLVKEKDARIAELEQDLDSQNNGGIVRRSLVDVQKIQNLEEEIQKLKEENKRGVPTSLGKTVSVPNIAESDYISHLKERIKKLETENEIIGKDAEERIKSLHKDYNNLRTTYENQLTDLTIKQKEVEAVVQLKDQKLKDLENGGLPEGFDIPFRRRILELETLVDEQSKRIDSILNDKNNLERQLLGKMKEKDKLIESYEARLVELQKAFHDKVFAVDEFKHMDDMLALKKELEICQRELADVRNKLEISECTRKSVHETTLTILKQAQEDSAKIALSHHQQAMHSLLKEMKKDGLGGLGSQSLNAENELELKTLRERLLETEKELDKAYSKIRDLEEALNLSEEKEKFLLGNLKALEESQVSLERDLDDARRGWPPSMHHLENLTLQIRQLEQSSKKRESEIENLIKLSREDAAQAFAQDRQELLDLIQKKDVEILGFKKELDSMVSSILQLKKQQQQGHTFVNARQKLF